mmetsp:Transcript_37274/g.88191  ORF Transcript_37274/g.88191 Transcript_37274/m.88191 type:complete len:205 (+) Transcript_37274:418-1032(+)
MGRPHQSRPGGRQHPRDHINLGRLLPDRGLVPRDRNGQSAARGRPGAARAALVHLHGYEPRVGAACAGGVAGGDGRDVGVAPHHADRRGVQRDAPHPLGLHGLARLAEHVAAGRPQHAHHQAHVARQALRDGRGAPHARRPHGDQHARGVGLVRGGRVPRRRKPRGRVRVPPDGRMEPLDGGADARLRLRDLRRAGVLDHRDAG